MSSANGATQHVVDEETYSALESLGRALHLKDPDLQSTLDAVVAAASDTIEHADFASVSLVVRGKFEARAASGAAICVLAAFQQEHGRGPCIDASLTQSVVRIPDMSVELQWPGFATEGQNASVLSMLCVPLWVDDTRIGSLSLYASVPYAFDEQDELLAGLFAMHAALALSDSQRTESLREALHNRDVIGQAKGILMERQRITADQAFVLLAETSQRRNRKLVDIADAFVQTGELG